MASLSNATNGFALLVRCDEWLDLAQKCNYKIKITMTRQRVLDNKKQKKARKLLSNAASNLNNEKNIVRKGCVVIHITTL
jgi:hypothetical protein